MSLTVQAFKTSHAERLGQQSPLGSSYKMLGSGSRRRERQISAWLNGLSGRTMIKLMVARLLRKRVGLIVPEAGRELRRTHRLMLRWAETVLASPDIFRRLAQNGVASTPVLLDGNRSPFAQHASRIIWRYGLDAYRMVHAGDLSPDAGAADFLSCLISWCERHPNVPVNMLWLGDGDLRGVLQAQCLPANLTQTFETIPDRDGWQAKLARCGLLVVPSVAGFRADWLIDAMASGLPVLGSARSPQVRALVEHGENGWLFDPLRPNEMFGSIEAALLSSPEALNEMREAAWLRVAPQPVRNFAPWLHPLNQHLSHCASASS